MNFCERALNPRFAESTGHYRYLPANFRTKGVQDRNAWAAGGAKEANLQDSKNSKDLEENKSGF